MTTVGCRAYWLRRLGRDLEVVMTALVDIEVI